MNVIISNHPEMIKDYYRMSKQEFINKYTTDDEWCVSEQDYDFFDSWLESKNHNRAVTEANFPPRTKVIIIEDEYGCNFGTKGVVIGTTEYGETVIRTCSDEIVLSHRFLDLSDFKSHALEFIHELFPEFTMRMQAFRTAYNNFSEHAFEFYSDLYPDSKPETWKEIIEYDDYEKMIDFFSLDEDEFLESYSYLTKGEYDETLKVLECLNAYSEEIRRSYPHGTPIKTRDGKKGVVLGTTEMLDIVAVIDGCLTLTNELSIDYEN